MKKNLNTKEAKNICFVANNHLTFFYDEIATRLQTKGINIFWIVVNRKLRDFLINKYGTDAVLYLSKLDVKHVRVSMGDFRLNELVDGDRFLRYQTQWAYSFLNNIQQPIYDFLKRHVVQYVFGENTWAHEILIQRLVSSRLELKCSFYVPHTVRMPYERFGFFTDEYQSNLALLVDNKKEQSKNNPPPALQAKKPDYLALNDLSLKQDRKMGAQIARLKRYFTMENIDQEDPTRIVNRWHALWIAFAEEFNRETYRLVPKTKFDETIASQNFVLLGLHKQPESSIDVIGRYYDNQYTNIVNIWRSLPDNWLLLVKEHTNAIGDRSWFFYRKLRRLRNVVLIDENVDSHDLIRRSRLVVTVSGTIAYEAALMGIPSLTFADVFFNRFLSCRKFNLDDLRDGGLSRLIQSIDSGNGSLFSSWLNDHSAEGIISDPVSNPACMTQENLDYVARAFLVLCSTT